MHLSSLNLQSFTDKRLEDIGALQINYVVAWQGNYKSSAKRFFFCCLCNLCWFFLWAGRHSNGKSWVQSSLHRMTTWRDHVARARLSLPFVQDFPIKMNVFANCQNMLLAGSLGWLLTSSSQGGFEPWSGMTVAGSSSYLFTVWAMRRLCAFPNRFKLSYCVPSSILNMLGIWKSVCSASKLNWPLLVTVSVFYVQFHYHQSYWPFNIRSSMSVV